MGFVNYLDALKLQEKLVSDRKLCRIPDTLLSLQHPPTYTLGKRQTDHNLLIPASELKNIGAELHYTRRGGDITFHGPRQAILYPIISLREIGLGARNYVVKLESTMIELSFLYGVKACAGQKGETGVWVGERKIDKEVTSLSRETSTVLPSEEVIHGQLISCFARLFGYNTVVCKENPSIVSDHEEIE
ncbi:Octanoyltransferase [Hibiscus syriacus]|uniref:Octanoyltransferase n=1 Tax=Hibiscus syriacus TaxID=106335 RepID=A0A6A2XT67_HIBSY|nr:Octanoyltransferase [Hibiscus syriacus]